MSPEPFDERASAEGPISAASVDERRAAAAQTPRDVDALYSLAHALGTSNDPRYVHDGRRWRRVAVGPFRRRPWRCRLAPPLSVLSPRNTVATASPGHRRRRLPAALFPWARTRHHPPPAPNRPPPPRHRAECKQLLSGTATTQFPPGMRVECQLVQAIAAYADGELDAARTSCEAVLRSLPDHRRGVVLHAAILREQARVRDKERADMMLGLVGGGLALVGAVLVAGVAAAGSSRRRSRG